MRNSGSRASSAILIAALLLSSNSSQAFEYVNSQAEFSVYVLSHRARVLALAVELYRSFEDYKSVVSEDLVREFVELHDLSKTRDEVSRALFIAYGSPVAAMPPELRKEFEAQKDRLNAIDNSIAEGFFLQNKLGEAERNALLEIEKLADLVDRGLDPVAREDFARPMKKASEYLTNPVLIEKAKLLESRYPLLIPGRDFTSVRARSSRP